MPTRNRRRNSQNCGGSKKTATTTRNRRRNSQHCGGSKKTATTTTHNQPTAKLPKPKPKPKKKSFLRKVGEVVGVGAAVGVVVAGAALARARTTNQDQVKQEQEDAGVVHTKNSYDDIRSRIDKMIHDCKKTNPSNILNQLLHDTDQWLDGDDGKLHAFSKFVQEGMYPKIQNDKQYLNMLLKVLDNAHNNMDSIQSGDIKLVTNIEYMSQHQQKYVTDGSHSEFVSMDE